MILDVLADEARERVRERQQQVSADTVRRDAETLEARQEKRNRAAEGFAAALARPGLSLICECKKASPSKGLISPDFPYREIARAYEEGGAAAISCLTEPRHFLGRDAYLQALDALAAGGMQYVFVSHYEEDAPSSADRVAQMKDGHLTVLR